MPQRRHEIGADDGLAREGFLPVPPHRSARRQRRQLQLVVAAQVARAMQVTQRLGPVVALVVAHPVVALAVAQQVVSLVVAPQVRLRPTARRSAVRLSPRMRLPPIHQTRKLT